MRAIVERGTRRVFVRVPQWPGWCRSARDEAAALHALLAYRGRYGEAVGEKLPASAPVVQERLAGTRVTDFGALAVVADSDREPWTAAERDRQLRLLRAAWNAFDRALAAVPARRRGEKPKQGRTPDAIALHVLETDLMHRAGAGGAGFRKPSPDGVEQQLSAVRGALLEALVEVPLGTPFVAQRRAGFDWTPPFVLQRSAWHALDHAWELEDRG